MVRLVFVLLLTWSVSSWLMEEVFFFVPITENIVARVEEMIAIPRHDKWKGARVRSELQRLSHEVQLGRTAQHLRKVWFRKGGINTRILNGERLFGFTLADAQLERFFDRQQVVWWDG